MLKKVAVAYERFGLYWFDWKKSDILEKWSRTDLDWLYNLIPIVIKGTIGERFSKKKEKNSRLTSRSSFVSSSLSLFSSSLAWLSSSSWCWKSKNIIVTLPWHHCYIVLLSLLHLHFYFQRVWKGKSRMSETPRSPPPPLRGGGRGRGGGNPLTRADCLEEEIWACKLFIWWERTKRKSADILLLAVTRIHLSRNKKCTYRFRFFITFLFCIF